MQGWRKTDAESGWSGSPVRLCLPESPLSPAVFSSPHSGRIYPPGFVRSSRLSALGLRASEDAFVDELFADAPEFGAPLIAAEFPRAFLDANRGEDELDPALIARFSTRKPRTLRVSAGLGVVPRVVAEGMPIYDGKLKLADVQERIEQCHRPYHEALVEHLAVARRAHGVALLIDCHSMPSSPARFAGRSADIVIGDCYGSSASGHISDAVFSLFRRAGFRVARNAPFAGGYITQRYGAPPEGIHALQIEINRALYLDQRRIERSDKFETLRAAMRPIIAEICAMPLSGASALAAE